MTRRALAFLAAMTLATLAGITTAAPATAAETPCYWNTVRQAFTETWVSAPVPLGTKVCYTETTAQGWRWSPDLGRYVHPAGPALAPNMGGASGTYPRIVANRARAMARDEGVVLQFAYRDLAGRGCFWNNTSSAAYIGDGQGTGFVRMGNSNRASCNGNLNVTLSSAAHELAHAWIEKTCGTTRPPMATGRDRMEDVTSALGYMHFDDEVARWGGTIVRGTYTGNDVWRAKQLLSGRCA
jgi:hypothetical protein